MSAQDLIFTLVSSGLTIYDPETLNAGTPTSITVTNLGDDDLTGLGLYIVPATNVGDVDNPADYPPATDYQDLLTWGQQVALGLQSVGGIKITCTQNSGSFSGHVTRVQGATYATKIPFVNLVAGASSTFTVLFETPPGVAARRFFTDLKLE
jgi:hypothetical protein